MFDFVGILALVVLGALFLWLVLRARRAQKPVVKWGGLVVSGLLSLVFTLALLVALVGFYKLNVPPYHNVVADIKVARTPAQVARGERFAFYCAGCHSLLTRRRLWPVRFSAEAAARLSERLPRRT